MFYGLPKSLVFVYLSEIFLFVSSIHNMYNIIGRKRIYVPDGFGISVCLYERFSIGGISGLLFMLVYPKGLGVLDRCVYLTK